jgi:Fe-S cluster assembly protein SufB
MIHLGKNTTSRIISKGIAAGHSDNTYRGIVSTHPQGQERAQLHPVRFAADRRQVRRAYRALHRGQDPHRHLRARGDDLEDLRRQLFYCQQRGLNEEEAVALIVNGFVRDVLQQLPMEFMAETQKLIGISLEGSVG